MTNESIKKQIKENVEELKIRAMLNHGKVENMKACNFKPAMYREHEDEIIRIAGMIDTYMSCYQMLDNE